MMKFNKKSLVFVALLGILLISFVSAFSISGFFNNLFGKITGNVIADSSNTLNVDFAAIGTSPKSGPAVVGSNGDFWNALAPIDGLNYWNDREKTLDRTFTGLKWANGASSPVAVRMVNLAGGWSFVSGVNDPMLNTHNYQYDVQRGNNGLDAYVYIYNLSSGTYDLYLYGGAGRYHVLVGTEGNYLDYGRKDNTQDGNLVASTTSWVQGIQYQKFTINVSSGWYIKVQVIQSDDVWKDAIIAGLQLLPAQNNSGSGGGGSTNQTITCTDSDNGLNYFVTGTTIDKTSVSYRDKCVWSNVSGVQNTTSCSGSNCNVVENYCNSVGGASIDIFQCPNGCLNGACINQTNTIYSCRDSDNGLNYYVKGNVSFSSCTISSNGGGCGGSSVSDSCLTNSTANLSANPGFLRETYCTNDNHSTFIDYQCPNGCLDGKCYYPGLYMNTSKLNYSSSENVILYMTVASHDGRAMKVDLYYIAPNATTINGQLERHLISSGITIDGTSMSNISPFSFDNFNAGSGSYILLACDAGSNCNASMGGTNSIVIYVDVSSQVCSQLIDVVKNPASFNDSYGIQYYLTQNDTYVNYDSVSYTAGWNANDDSNHYYIFKNVQVFNDKTFNATNLVKDMTRYNTCVERHYGTSTQYVCNYDLLSNNNGYKYNQVFWANNNVLVEETLLSSNNALTQSEIDSLSIRNAVSLLDSIKNNQFKYTDGFEIDYRLSSLLSDDVSVCPSDLPTGELPYGMNCKLEPVICPEYGYQKQICQFYNEQTKQMESKETQKYCSPGVCSGCYVPRWFGSSAGDNTCVTYGTRLAQSSIDGTDALGEGYESQGSFDDYLNLTIYDSNSASLKIVSSGQIVYDSYMYVGNVYFLSDGGKIQFKLQKIVPKVGEKTFKVGESFKDEGAYIHVDAVNLDSVVVNGKSININESARVGDGITVRVVDIGYHSNAPESSIVVLDIGGYIIISQVKTFDAYCNYDGNIMQQKTTDFNGEWAKCQNNYECESNQCSSGECIPVQQYLNQGSVLKSLVVKVLCRIANIFDPNAGYQQCLADYGVN